MDTASMWYCGKTISLPLFERKRREFSDISDLICGSNSDSRAASGVVESTSQSQGGISNLDAPSESPQHAGNSPHRLTSDAVCGMDGMDFEVRSRVMSGCSVSASAQRERTPSGLSENCSPSSSPHPRQSPTGRGWIGGAAEIGGLAEEELFNRVCPGSASIGASRLLPIDDKCIRVLGEDDYHCAFEKNKPCSPGRSNDSSSNESWKNNVKMEKATWTPGMKMEQATWTPGMKMEQGTLVPGPGQAVESEAFHVDCLKSIGSRRSRRLSTQPCLKPLQRQSQSMAEWQFGGFAEPVDAEIGALDLDSFRRGRCSCPGTTSPVAFKAKSFELLSPLNPRLEESLKLSDGDDAVWLDKSWERSGETSIRRRLNESLQRCMQLQKVQTDNASIGEDDAILCRTPKKRNSNAASAVASVGTKNKSAKLVRSQSDPSLGIAGLKMTSLPSPEIQVLRRGLKPSKHWNAAKLPGAHISRLKLRGPVAASPVTRSNMCDTHDDSVFPQWKIESPGSKQ